MAIEVPKIQDEVTEFLKRFRRENSFASGLARDKFRDAMNRLPSDKKVEFITAYMNNPAGGEVAAGAALVRAIQDARSQVEEEVLASTLKNYGRRLSGEDKAALAQSVKYSASEAVLTTLAALAKESGVKASAPVQEALKTRIDLTLREAAPRKSGERSTVMVPSAPPPSRTELPEDKATVSYTGQEVWFAPEDKKEENPIRVGVKLAERPDVLEKLAADKDRIAKQIRLIRIKAGAERVGGRRVLDKPVGKGDKVIVGQEVVIEADPAKARALLDLLAAKESEYGLKTPDIGELRKLEVQLAYVDEAIRLGVVGGYVPVNPNEGLKRVKIKVKKEVVRGRGKKRGPVVETVEETAYVPKEIVGPQGSRESVLDAATRFDNAVRQRVNLILAVDEAAGQGIDPEVLETAAGLLGEKIRAEMAGRDFEIPDEYKEAAKYYAAVRRRAELEVKSSTPVSGATRIAKGTEFQSKEEARAFKKAMKAGPSRVRDMILAGSIDKIVPVDAEFIEEFKSAGYVAQIATAEKLFKKLKVETRKELVADLADREYGPFRWRVGPSGVVDRVESQQADSKAVTMLDQKPEMFPRISASQRMGGARRSDEPASSWANLDLFRAGRNLKPQQRMAQAVYLNPDWISATFGTEALRRVIGAKVAVGDTRAPETSITRWDLAQAGYNPYGEEADITAAEMPVTMFARALDAWERDTFRKRNENIILPPMILIGQGENRRLVPANSPEGKRFLIQTNATAYLYGGPEARSLKTERKQEKELIDLAEEMVVEDLIGEGFDPDQNPKLFYGKMEELLPLRLNVLLLDGPLVSQNLIDAAGLYNERLRTKFIAPKQAVAGGLKAKPVRADPKSEEAIKAEAGFNVATRYGINISGGEVEVLEEVSTPRGVEVRRVKKTFPPRLMPPPTVDQILSRLRNSGWLKQIPGRTEKSMRAAAVRQYNAAVQNYAQQYDRMFKQVAENYEKDLEDEARRLRLARGAVGFKRTKEEAAVARQERKLREAQEQARQQELEASQESGERQFQETLSRERGVFRRDPKKEGKLPFILSDEPLTLEQEIDRLQREREVKGIQFPKFKQKRLNKLLAQRRIVIEKKGMSGLGFGFGSYDLGSQITAVAVGGLVVFSLFKAIQSGMKKA